MYYDRRVTNKEVAERVAVVGAKEIQDLCQKLCDPSKVYQFLFVVTCFCVGKCQQMQSYWK